MREHMNKPDYPDSPTPDSAPLESPPLDGVSFDRVGIVGMGYVGIPLALSFAAKQTTVLGFDIDPAKVESVNRGESYIKHIPSADIAKYSDGKQLSATANFDRVQEVDAILICVPTPLNKNREPNMTFVKKTAENIGPFLKKGQLVCLESTTYPGTTRELLVPILEEASGLKAGTDFFVCYSPEREDPANPKFSTTTIPKVIGGLTSRCAELGTHLYRKVIAEVVVVTSPEVAEMSKLLENIFRSVNIALVNELKVLCHRMGIDIWEVVEAASTKPFGFMPFYPGPGLGGHCIPIDPFYLTWKAREYNLSTRFIELAGEVNSRIPEFVVDRVAEALNDFGKALNGARILLLGVAYKKNVDDMRESPALRIMELLQKRRAKLEYHDPHIPMLSARASGCGDQKSVELDANNVSSYDAVVIVTDHSEIDYQFVCDTAQLVVDTRNVTASLSTDNSKVYKA